MDNVKYGKIPYFMIHVYKIFIWNIRVARSELINRLTKQNKIYGNKKTYGIVI